MKNALDRRRWLQVSAASLAAGATTYAAVGGETAAHGARPAPPRVRYCLNTSTIREQKLGLQAEIELAADCGYDGIEPWIREIEAYQQQGGRLEDLAQLLKDRGLSVENAIGFAAWIVDDDAQRKAALEQARRDMDLVRRLGGTRIAAPPVGATDEENFDLFRAAERYGELLRIGREIGVTPQLELWGFSKTLSRLGELLLVASECGEPDASLLPDVYHIFKGGSDFQGLRLLDPAKIPVFHINDYPAEPPRASMADADRVYPGDGIAPLTEIFGDLLQRGFQGALSLELFNPTYWRQDARLVAQTGLAKMKAVVAAATA